MRSRVVNASEGSETADPLLEVTERAKGVIQEFLEQQTGPRAVRILVQPG